METKILPYPPNQVECIQQNDDESLDLRCAVYIDVPLWRHDHTNSQGVRVYTFISLKIKGDIFLIHLTSNFLLCLSLRLWEEIPL